LIFEIVSFTDALRTEWDSIVNKSKQGSFLHKVDYFTYHQDRFDDCSLVVYKKGKPVAIFPANKINNDVYSHSGLTYAGLIYGNELSATDVLMIFELIKRRYRKMGLTKLYYKCIPNVFCNYPADEILYAIFRNDGVLYRRDIGVVIELGSIQPGYSKLRKRMIKKAVKADLHLNEELDFRKFHRLLSNVLKKFRAKPTHTIDELELLKSKFPGEIRLFTATASDGQLMAGTITYDFGHAVHTQYLASSDDGRNVGALDYLLADLIENVFSEKDYFSFGICTEDNGLFLNEGLLSQKEGFGGRAIVNDFYMLNLSND
jgi:hypothetical protein